MPAKRAILLERTTPGASHYRYVLWADVPAANQIAYRNPAATSAFGNATPAELQAIRDGLVVERVGNYKHDSAAIGTIQTWLEGQWTSFQADITAQSLWTDFGRYWDGAAWQVSPGIPMASAKEVPEGIPSYLALTPVSAFAANKFHFVLHNGASITLGQSFVVKIRLVAILPGLSAVTGAAPSVWTLRRRQALTTPPSGTGGIVIASMDSAFVSPSIITNWNAPSVSPAGGTLVTINEFVPQADEQKMTTADAPTLGAMFSNWGGQVIYRSADAYPARPLTLRAGETLEVQQSATAGTGNARVLCLFTMG